MGLVMSELGNRVRGAWAYDDRTLEELATEIERLEARPMLDANAAIMGLKLVSAEREACAKIAERYVCMGRNTAVHKYNIATAIRARGDKP
jgi:hypothetical protein